MRQILYPVFLRFNNSVLHDLTHLVPKFQFALHILTGDSAGTSVAGYCRNVTTTPTRLIYAMKTKSSLPRFCAIAFALGASTSNQFAADVVNDTWLDGTRTDPASPAYSEYGYDSDADLNTESAWLKGGAGTLAVVGAGGPLRGSGFAGSPASWYTYFTPAATPITLGSGGDTMKLTWAFTPSGVNAGNTSQGFLLAVAQ